MRLMVNYSNMVCPKCKSSDLVFLAKTAALFKINPDGTMGRSLLNDEGIECIDECVSETPSDVKVYCLHCYRSFNVCERENGDDGFEIDDSI